MIDSALPVAQVVLDHPECAEVFQRHRIDFCCRGRMSIDAAAGERGVDPAALIGDLERAIAERRGEPPADPRGLSTPALIAHIVSRHHELLRKALPFARSLAAKVGRVHGDHNPKLRDLDRAVGELADTLLAHLDDEEQALFPALMARGSDRAETTRRLEAMVTEHLEVARLLERIRAASEDFAVPEWACTSYRTLFAELRGIESDIFTHVHLENHVLGPRFAEAAERAAT